MESNTMDKIIEHLECTICNNSAIEHNFTCVKCSAILCSPCLDNWIKTYTSKNNNNAIEDSCSCPTCRTVLTRSQWIHNRALQKIIDLVEMECSLCGQVLPVGQMEIHRKRTCNQFVVKCPSDECNYESKRKDIQSHIEECNYVIVECQCGEQLRRVDLQPHIDRWCSFDEDLEILNYKAEESLRIASTYPNTREKIKTCVSLLHDIKKNFRIAFVGKSKVGKTTIINSLLEENLLKIEKTTINSLVYYSASEKPQTFKVINNEVISIKEEEIIENDNENDNIQQLIFTSNSKLLKCRSIELLDCIADQYENLPNVDTVVYVIDASDLKDEKTWTMFAKLSDKYGTPIVIINKCDPTQDQTQLQKDITEIFNDTYFATLPLFTTPENTWNENFSVAKFELNKHMFTIATMRYNQLVKSVDRIFREMSYTQAIEQSETPAVRLINELLWATLNGNEDFGIDSAYDLGKRYQDSYDKIDDQISSLIQWQMLNNAGTGFVTGLGGFATMIVSVPTGLLALWFVGTRLAATIAYLYGHDLEDPAVQEAIILCLLMDKTEEEVKKCLSAEASNKTQENLSSSNVTAEKQMIRRTVNKVARETTKRVIQSTLKRGGGKKFAKETAKLLGTRLLTKGAVKSVARFIPIVSGIVGGALDMHACRCIGLFATNVFRT